LRDGGCRLGAVAGLARPLGRFARLRSTPWPTGDDNTKAPLWGRVLQLSPALCDCAVLLLALLADSHRTLSLWSGLLLP